MAHIQPQPKNLHADLEPLFDYYKNTRGFIPNSILTMQMRPNISKAFMQLNQAVLYEGTVSEELKMLVSLIASQAAGCKYCQAHMANLSKIYEASKEKIEAVWEFQTSPLFTEAERAALNLAFKGALVPNEVEAADFEELKKYFDDGFPDSYRNVCVTNCTKVVFTQRAQSTQRVDNQISLRTLRSLREIICAICYTHIGIELVLEIELF